MTDGKLRRSTSTLRARLLRNPKVLLSGGLVLGLILAAYVVPLPHNPILADSAHTLQAPGRGAWFGTDQSGFDVFSRTIAAARLDLPLAILGTLVSMVVGVPIGLLATSRGRLASNIMRGFDIFQAFPLLLLAIVIVALTGNDLRNIVFAIAFINVPRFTRLVRSEALALRESRFVEAAIAMGASQSRVMFAHLLPNVSGSILVQASLTAAHALVVIAGMSFLGVGIVPPTPSWGALIRTGVESMVTGQWWVAVFPGLMVLAMVLCFNEFADGVHGEIASARTR